MNIIKTNERRNYGRNKDIIYHDGILKRKEIKIIYNYIDDELINVSFNLNKNNGILYLITND